MPLVLSAPRVTLVPKAPRTARPARLALLALLEARATSVRPGIRA